MADRWSRTSWRDRRGFTLLELLVASGLFVTAAVSLMQLFAMATRATVDARHTTLATLLAAQKIEQLRAEPYPPGVPFEGEDVVDARGVSLGTITSGAAYRRRWRVEPLSSNPSGAVVMAVDVAPRGTERAVARLVTVRARVR